MGKPKLPTGAKQIHEILELAKPWRVKDRKKYLEQVNGLFDRLLTTWPLRFTKWRDGFSENGTPIELEIRFGDGHFSDRQNLLHIAVNFVDLRDSALLPGLFIILYDARQMAATTALKNAKLLNSHAVGSTERHLHARAVKHLRAYREHLATSSPRSGRWIIEKIDTTILALDQVAPPLNSKLAHKRPVLVDLKAIRAQLTAIGVPKGIRGFRQARASIGCDATPRNLPDALLMAVGLIPYRNGLTAT